MTQSPHSPIPLIVGAGPTGLMLSLWLNKFHVPHRIVSASPGTGTSSRAIVMHARSLEFYRQLGLSDTILAAGTRVDRLAIHTFGKLRTTISLADCGRGLSRYPFSLSITQDAHEAILERAIVERGGQVEFGVEVVDVAQEAGGDDVHVTLKNDGKLESFVASYVIGCDGAHSTVRRSMDVNMEGGTYDGAFFVSDVDISSSATILGQLNIYFADHDVHIVMPLPHPEGRARILGRVPRDAENIDPANLTFAHVEPGVMRNVHGIKVENVNWFSRWIVHHRTADRFQRGRIFLCGDAAHIHSPFGGQGMNTGLGDATNLAWKIAAVCHGAAPPSLLETYSTERIPFAKELVNTTDRAFTVATGSSFLSLFIRNLVIPYVLPLVIWVFAIGPTMYKKVSQIKVEYRSSTLSVNVGTGWAGNDAKAGDRLPWAEKIDRSGSDNHEFLKTADWQAHVYGRADAWAEEIITSRGIPLHVFSWTSSMSSVGLRQDTTYLVRPDGHIGLAVIPDDGTNSGAKLEEYLEKWNVGKSLR